MPRHKGDHEARRRDVSGAVWRVLAARGFGGLTLRAVATEMGATTGLLTHYFPNKQDLLAHALTLLDERRATRPRRVAAPAAEGLAALRAALLDILPLTPEAAADNRIWVSSWDAALADPDLAAGHADRYGRSRERIRRHVAAAQGLGELPSGDPDDLAAAIQSFVLGLIVQALLGAEAFPPERQIRLLDRYLAALTTPC
ncbi:TetR family transcriptional regulator [Longispora fulva]|uniref:AcrR family transcriptional regulator n=1 Tax=Longispora fulva TaxID=619741 RepID=A0A8J7GB44_9ACTN|nr:TetR/AcrR family transcriptional regulator [Longispora fulva]MBG6135159.1 AcrR family transcriptional regulator [Longispora fulva]GIG56606.1 TetR family transcriptional regulator [Longispora fulva]